jgi:phasin family protein
MNAIEKQVKLGRDLFEINSSVVRELVQLQVEGVRKYFETNQEFAKRLPEVKDVSTFVELQREYNQTVWESAQSNLRTGGELVRDTASQVGEAVRSVFNAEEETVAAAPRATKTSKAAA